MKFSSQNLSINCKKIFIVDKSLFLLDLSKKTLCSDTENLIHMPFCGHLIYEKCLQINFFRQNIRV